MYLQINRTHKTTSLKRRAESISIYYVVHLQVTCWQMPFICTFSTRIRAPVIHDLTDTLTPFTRHSWHNYDFLWHTGQYRSLSRRLDRCDRGIQSEAKDPFGGNLYVTMQIPFFTCKFRYVQCNLHCDVVHITTKWVFRHTLDCNGVFAIKAYSFNSVVSKYLLMSI